MVAIDHQARARARAAEEAVPAAAVEGDPRVRAPREAAEKGEAMLAEAAQRAAPIRDLPRRMAERRVRACEEADGLRASLAAASAGMILGEVSPSKERALLKQLKGIEELIDRLDRARPGIEARALEENRLCSLLGHQCVESGIALERVRALVRRELAESRR